MDCYCLSCRYRNREQKGILVIKIRTKIIVNNANQNHALNIYVPCAFDDQID